MTGGKIMQDKQPRSDTYGKAQVSGDVPQKSPDHGPYGHTNYDQTSQPASSVIRPEENDKNPNMPCKNSLPT
jgi:hypothetical protein